jgi:hypothetical protein
VVYPWAVECAALHAAEWRSAFSNAEALSVLLAARAGHHAVPGAADRAEGRGDHGGGGCRDRGGGGGGRGNRQARQKDEYVLRADHHASASSATWANWK